MNVQAGAPISVYEAQIHTAAVEIKTLTIRGKQVTLAVFRQLQEESIIDDNHGGLRGLPWGRVNYHPPDCDRRLAHLHVIWQKDDELRRSCASEESPHRYDHWHADRLEAEAYHWLHHALQEGWRPSGPIHHNSYDGYYLYVQFFEACSIKIYINTAYTEMIAVLVNGSPLTAEMITAQKMCLCPRQKSHIEAEIQRIHEEIQDYGSRYAQSYAILQETPQLFIAV
jgi:hypothetical protein